MALRYRFHLGLWDFQTCVGDTKTCAWFNGSQRWQQSVGRRRGVFVESWRQLAKCAFTVGLWSIIERNGYSDVGDIHVVQCHIVVVRHCSRQKISTCHVSAGLTCVWRRLRCSRCLAHSGPHIGGGALSHVVRSQTSHRLEISANEA